jgi:cytoskeleton protein RodZ
MTIEGLGKKFQEARLARRLSLEEAARMTKIRPSRLAEIEADDFSQFPSLAYAKGFLLIYGKFLDVDVTPYLEAFESSQNVTVDGYSYLQEGSAPKPARAPIDRAPRRRSSLWPLVIAVGLLVVGFSAMKLIINLKRLAPRTETMIGVPEASIPSPSPAPASPAIAALPSPHPAASAPTAPPASPPVVAAAKSPEPEVRRAKPVGPEDLEKEVPGENAPPAESAGDNRVDIKPLRKAYLRVVVNDGAKTSELERWVSPADGPLQFHGKHVAIRLIDRNAVQITKNGKLLSGDDSDVTIQSQARD